MFFLSTQHFSFLRGGICWIVWLSKHVYYLFVLCIFKYAYYHKMSAYWLLTLQSIIWQYLYRMCSFVFQKAKIIVLAKSLWKQELSFPNMQHHWKGCSFPTRDIVGSMDIGFTEVQDSRFAKHIQPRDLEVPHVSGIVCFHSFWQTNMSDTWPQDLTESKHFSGNFWPWSRRPGFGGADHIYIYLCINNIWIQINK